MRYETVQILNEEDFKRCTGVQCNTLEQMLAIVEAGLRNFGRPTTLSRVDQLLMTLMYWREDRTEFHIGLTYGVSESTVCRTIHKVENVLIQSKQFHLPSKKVLRPSDTIFEIVMMDATEQPVERPKKRHCSGKKKRHTQKAQLIADLSTEQILATDFCHESCQDFQLFKQSRSIIAEYICILADAGYQGLVHLHENS